MSEQIQHAHSVGAMPTNPLIDGGYVYEIANVEPYMPPVMEGEEPDGQTHWQFDILGEPMKVEQYVKKVREDAALMAQAAEDTATTTAYELTLELIGGGE